MVMQNPKINGKKIKLNLLGWKVEKSENDVSPFPSKGNQTWNILRGTKFETFHWPPNWQHFRVFFLFLVLVQSNLKLEWIKNPSTCAIKSKIGVDKKSNTLWHFLESKAPQSSYKCQDNKITHKRISKTLKT